MIKNYKNLLLLGGILSISLIGFFLFRDNSENLEKVTKNTHKEKDFKSQEEQIYQKKIKEDIISKREIRTDDEKNKDVFQVILGKKYYDKESSTKALQAFFDGHPYSNRPIMTKQEWKKIPKQDRPDLAWEQDFLSTLDPALGYVPYDRKIKAYQETQDLLNSSVGGKSAISGVNWTERGPNNIGGRTRAILFDPNDATNKKVWAGGVTGGLWYTNDITIDSPWTRVDDFWSNIAISAIAADPNDSQTFYVGTGEAYTVNGSSSARGAGMWKTTDGGTTWTQMTSGNGFFVTDTEFYWVTDIVVRDESGTSVLYVGVARANHLGGGFLQGQGLYRSTDGGVNFTQVLQNAPSGGRPFQPSDIEIAADNRIYIGTRDNSSGSGGGYILYSDNGTSWTEINFSGTNNADRVEIACAPDNADYVYAVAQNDNASTSSEDVAFFKKTTNATSGMTWTDITIPNYYSQSCTVSTDDFTRGQAWYDLILAVHPTDETTVIVGGVDLHRSTDEGANWSPISYWTGSCFSYVHADQHQLVFRPGNDNEIIAGTDGGVSYSPDVTATTPVFSNRNNGYNITQFYAVAARNTTTSNEFLAGAQDNGTQRFSDGNGQRTVSATGGDGAFCFIDQDNPMFQLTAFQNNSWSRSTDGGVTFSSLATGSSGRFINPADYDNDADILYAASANDEIYRITDITGTPSAGDVSVSLGSADASTLVASPHTANRIFVGTDNGQIFRIDNANGTPSSTDIDPGGSLPASNISSIDVGASDNQLLVTLSNYGITSVWETPDGGTTWNNKEGAIPDMPIRWGLYNPDNRDEVLLATELGVWSTDNFDNGGTGTPTWGPSNSGLANVRCDMLQYRAADKVVVIATHGRGLFTTDIFATATADFEAQTTTWTANKLLQFTDKSLKATSWEWDFDNDGSVDATDQNPSYRYTTAGTYTVTLTINAGASSETKTSYITIIDENTIPYDQDFNTNNGGFFPYHIDRDGRQTFTTWEWGETTTGNFNSGNGAGTIEGVASWATSLANNHGFNTIYALESPPFSLLGGSGDYILEFRYRFACGTDAGFNLEYSTDGGSTWQILGNTSGNPSGTTGWYDTDNIIGLRNAQGWDPTSAFTIRTAQYNIASLIGEDDIRFRFVFGARGSSLDGVQIDNFKITGDPIIRWIGSTDSEWNVASNWSHNSVPTASDNVVVPDFGVINELDFSTAQASNNFVVQTGRTVDIGGDLAINGTIAAQGTVIFDGMATQTIATGGSFENLTVDNTNGVGLSDNLTITGNLTLTNGNLDANSNTVTLGTTGTLIETSGHFFDGTITAEGTINNEMNKDIGGLGAVISTTANMGTTTVNRRHVTPSDPDFAAGIGRIYDITPATNTGLNATLVYNFSPIDAAIVDIATAELYRSTSSGADDTWDLEGGTVSGNTIELTGINAFSSWTGGGDSNGGLPIGLLSFSGKRQNERNILLEWQTNIEINNQGFEIQQSDNARDFETLAFVEGVGNSTKINNYELIVNNASATYYRLKQIDFDGSFEYSNIVFIGNKGASIRIYPNPLGKQDRLKIESDLENIKVIVLDNRGKQVFTMEGRKEDVEKSLSIQFRSFISGLYFLQFITENDTQTLKLMKK